MSYLEAILLGVIQGLTEFLPVSSSGHLVLVQHQLGLRPGATEMLAFDVVSHVGTLAAVAIVFRRSIHRMLRSRRQLGRMILLGGIATVVTAVIGLTCEEWFKSLFDRPRLVGAAMMATGVMLFIPSRLPRPRKGWRQFRPACAAAIGVAQAVAIVPGISRSGSTICTALLLGIRRRWAAEFSFLIAAPAILGAAALQVREYTNSAATDHIARYAGPILIGGAVAFVTGLVALLLLLRVVHKSRLHWFSYYLWVVGLCALVWA